MLLFDDKFRSENFENILVNMKNHIYVVAKTLQFLTFDKRVRISEMMESSITIQISTQEYPLGMSKTAKLPLAKFFGKELVKPFP